MADEKSFTVSEFKELLKALGPSAAQDPVQSLQQILKTYEQYSDPKEDREHMIRAHETRFYNRRRMAYISLTALLGFGAAAIIGAVVDGLTCTRTPNAEGEVVLESGCTQIMASFAEATTIIGVLIGTLTAVVLSYYLSSAIKPSS